MGGEKTVRKLSGVFPRKRREKEKERKRERGRDRKRERQKESEKKIESIFYKERKSTKKDKERDIISNKCAFLFLKIFARNFLLNCLKEL